MEMGAKELRAQKPYIDKFRPIREISLSQVLFSTLLQPEDLFTQIVHVPGDSVLKTVWAPKRRDPLIYLLLSIGLFFLEISPFPWEP